MKFLAHGPGLTPGSVQVHDLGLGVGIGIPKYQLSTCHKIGPLGSWPRTWIKKKVSNVLNSAPAQECNH